MRSTLRELLPMRRHAETFTLTFGGQNTEFSITVGFYDDGRIGEVFIVGAKPGSEMHALTHDAATMISIGLQYGVPLETFRHAVSRMGKESLPATIVGAVLDKINSMEFEK